MNINEVVFKAKTNGYFFVQDSQGFINIFDNEDIFKEDSDAQCIYRTKADCKTKREFDMEVILMVNKLDAMV